MKYQKGFSVLATVLVIAIIIIVGIGVWAWNRTTPTLNTLEQQREQGYDNNTKSKLIEFVTSAELYFDSQNPNSYGIAVTGNAGCSTPGSMFTSNRSRGGSNYTPLLDPNSYQPGTQFVCNVSAGGQAYAMQASLIGGGYWCIDSARQFKAESAPLGTSTVCQ
ncbi:MAG: hypothetical protein CO184_00140 [Candidatus Zambryskibacteria bacterium CG_4_9_14_3_um_filter_40_16]|uniref:Type II secretion system protein GspG C-terminal domain-containing protein n=2 Tax=Candidatus Zambryskiibacteriota TaxID=1817925 RepID=A0A2H0K6W2_9BACT|nr:MAG: hypothetical protein COV95_01170 [Candidatus Zambryskibacteria bacterium CG11_big_fil_rev_8_21_14_0_20_40_24]PJA34425.1 MAG: hypothetical protein CO184_00140 [Candidatus Zambryskibacteria bacterium CG_4_9_14_3_um_filter_40_16]